MKYRFVQRVEGQWIVTEVAKETLGAWLEGRALKVAGITGRRSMRAVLEGQPIISELVGPIWDGDAIRYENPEANAILGI